MQIQPISNAASYRLSSMPQSAKSSSEATETSETGETTTAKGKTAPPPPPAGGPRPVQSTGSAGSSASSASSTAKIYDPRDTNQDGVVSSQEELLFSLKQSSDETNNQQTVQSNQLQSALSAYKQSQSGISSTEGRSIFAV